MTRVHVDVPRDGVLRLRLDGPDSLNALDDGAKDELIAGLERAAADPTVRVVMLIGTGRAFCSGGDVKGMGNRTGPQTMAVLDKGRRITERMAGLSKPIVSAVNGLASGAGFNLALAGDILVAHHSSWFQQSFGRMGLVPDMGGTYFLARQVGLYRAKELLLTGRRLSAEEAQSLGLVAHVWGDDFEAQALDLCVKLAESATVALGLTKVLTNRSVEGSLQAALDREALAQGVAASTHDHRTAVEAFRNGEDLAGVRFEGR